MSLQFRNTSFDKLAFDSRERVVRIIRPALLKTRSLAAELAGTVKIFRPRGLRALNLLSFRTSRPRPETSSSDMYSECCCCCGAQNGLVLLMWPVQFGRKLVLGTRRKWPRPRRDRDVDNFSRDETETRRSYVSRPRRRDRDHNPGYTPTTNCN